VGDLELCNSAYLIHAQTATYHTKEKENKKSHHMTPLILSMLKTAELCNIFGDTVKLVFFSELFCTIITLLWLLINLTCTHTHTHTHAHTQYYYIIYIILYYIILYYIILYYIILNNLIITCDWITKPVIRVHLF